jgi:UDP-N-acetylglucosamine 4,6-dehydratase/5-epimerase
MDTSVVAGKTVLITGGTGSFGHTIADILANTDPKPREVRILSRHEDLQHSMQNRYPQFKYLIGDVRDLSRLREVLRGVDVVFQAAALKQVPDCELHPMEAVNTNIMGAFNVRTAAIENNVEAVAYISTDKAVKPVNVMGMTKAIQERLFSTPELDVATKFVGVRYGNVLGSRGSVVPYFISLAEQKRDLPVTDSRMTRFMLTLHNAVELVFFALANGSSREILVRKSPAAKIIELAEVICEQYGSDVRVTGIRPGEKIHEILIQEEEMRRAEEKGDYFVIHSHGEYDSGRTYEEYSSDKATLLTKTQIRELLVSERWIK